MTDAVMESAIVPVSRLDKEARINDIQTLMSLVIHMKDTLLVDGTDYGTIPGTGKPTLLLPGMEKFMRVLNVEPQYTPLHVVRDYERGLFDYEFECRLVDVDTGKSVPGGRGIGSCSSWESSFRWRWVPESRLPSNVDREGLETRDGQRVYSEFDFAVEKSETTGQYGKPQEYWDMFHTAISDGTARKIKKKSRKGDEYDAWEITVGEREYRIENPDLMDQKNPVLKRAKKRALGDAIKGAANVSEFFTVDVEDMSLGDVVEGEIVDNTATPATSSGGNGSRSGSKATRSRNPNEPEWWREAIKQVAIQHCNGKATEAESLLRDMLAKKDIEVTFSLEQVLSAVAQFTGSPKEKSPETPEESDDNDPDMYDPPFEPDDVDMYDPPFEPDDVDMYDPPFEPDDVDLDGLPPTDIGDIPF